MDIIKKKNKFRFILKFRLNLRNFKSYYSFVCNAVDDVAALLHRLLRTYVLFVYNLKYNYSSSVEQLPTYLGFSKE